MTQYSSAVVPNPDAINKAQVEKRAADKWARSRVNAIAMLIKGQITESEEQALSDLAYKEYNEATSEPILKLNDLLKPRPLHFEERK